MHSKHKPRHQEGFSLMELLVSMAAMAIITGAAFALIGSSLRYSGATFQMTDLEQSLRTANEMVNRDLITVGDGLKGIGTIQVPKAFVQTYLTQSPVVDASNPNYVNLALVTSDDAVPANTAVAQASPAVNVLPNTDRLTLLTQDSSFTPVTVLAGKISFSTPNTNIVVPASETSRFQVGEIYALVAQNSAAFFVISGVNSSTNTLTATNGDVYSINQTGSGTPINVVTTNGTAPSTIMRLQITHYFTNSSNLLVRRVFGVRGATFVDSVVAEHVTNLQFRYLTNLTDANGFVPQPVRQLSTSQQQLAVREVETTLALETARAVNPVSANNNGRQVVSSTTATTVRNLQFRQAL